MNYICENLKTETAGRWDTVVVGGGIAGVAAALASARGGARTLLLEKTVALGGLATSGHVVYYLPLCDGCGNKIIGGIAEELLYASIRHGYNNLPEVWRNGPQKADTRKRYSTVFNAPAFVMELDRLVLDAGIDILFDTVFCDVAMEGNACTAVIAENKSGRRAYGCKSVVDASGDADVFYRAGADCVEQYNHLTYWAYCDSDEDERVHKNGGAINLFTFGNFNGSDLPAGLRKYRGTDAGDVTQFIIKGRSAALDAMRTNPKLLFSSFPSQAQFRTTRRIKGDHTFRTEDAGKHYDDSIGCISIWNVPEPVYEIPFGTLKTASINNIFAAGRIISAACGQAWEIIRPIPACATTGQAAGSAAALLAKNGKEVDVGELKSILKKDGLMLTLSDALVRQSEKWLEGWRKDGDPWWKDKEDAINVKYVRDRI